MPPQQPLGTDSNDPVAMLTSTLRRLEARLERYRIEKLGTPDIDKAAGILKEAAEELDKLDPDEDQQEYMLKVHGINTKFYNFEQILPPLE